MLERVRKALAGEEAWIVGGALRDELLGRPVVDLDIACRDPEAAARRYGRPVFPLSERHGAWRVALDGGRTVDFTPSRTESKAISRRATSRSTRSRGRSAEAIQSIHSMVSATSKHGCCERSPRRSSRTIRCACCGRFGWRMSSASVSTPRRNGCCASTRHWSTVRRASESSGSSSGSVREGYERLAELGLLAPLGGRVDRLRALDDLAEMRLVAVFEERLERLPISNELGRYARALLRAKPPSDLSPRSVYRFRRQTEPWAAEAARFAGAGEALERVIEEARGRDPAEPLLRGDELGLPPGPEIGRLLELVEGRAAGTITTREEALDLVRQEAERP